MSNIHYIMTEKPNAVQTLSKKANVVLYLHLLHHPDYSYGIAETFKNVLKDQSVDTSKVKLLSDNSRIGVYLKDLKASEAIRESTRKDIKNRERVYYTIKPLGVTYPGGQQMDVIDDNTIDLIREISYNKERVGSRILSYKQHDIFTILLHIRHLLTSMTIYGYERLLPPEERVDYDNVLNNGLLNLKKLDKKPPDFWTKLNNDTRELDQFSQAYSAGFRDTGFNRLRPRIDSVHLDPQPQIMVANPTYTMHLNGSIM